MENHRPSLKEAVLYFKDGRDRYVDGQQTVGIPESSQLASVLGGMQLAIFSVLIGDTYGSIFSLSLDKTDANAALDELREAKSLVEAQIKRLESIPATDKYREFVSVEAIRIRSESARLEADNGWQVTIQTRS
jgi:hypothetical protein